MNIELLSGIDKSERIKASDLANWLLSHGVSAITTDELATLLGIPKNQVPSRMASLKRRGEIVSPAEGLWMPVSPEYLSWRAPPAIEIVDALMRHMNVDYYVGWLSAAELHGASHHAPQVFQVATSRAIRGRVVGRSRMQFYHRARINHLPLMQVETRNGVVPASSMEATLLDVANDIAIVGGIDNAANLVIELCEAAEPDVDTLAAISVYYPATALRRLGFLIENYTDVVGLEKLKKTCSMRSAAFSVLDPQAGHQGVINMDWMLRINREVNPDV